MTSPSDNNADPDIGPEATGPEGNRDVATRRRRAAYRASHRGTKEMDWLVGRYADAHVDALEGEALTHFERFLDLPDPELQRWLLEPETAASAGEFADLVRAVRIFHGLPAGPV